MIRRAYMWFRRKLFGDLHSLEVKLDDLTTRTNEALSRTEELQKHTMQYDVTGVMPISEKEIATKIFNDLIMYLDPRDIAIVPHIVLERIWEREVTHVWLSVLDTYIRRDAVVFDVGANFGYYGMLAAQRVDKRTGRVVMFEANPDLIYYIHKTLSVNWLNENTLVENVAVSNKRGKLKLNVLTDYVGSSSVQPLAQLESYLGNMMQVKAEKVVTVPAVKLDDYCRSKSIDRIDLMIMDIEGYEVSAYEGMRDVVSKSPDMVLFMEFTPAGYPSPQKFYETLLDDFGYVYIIKPDGHLSILSDTSYEKVISSAEIFTFLVFSKKKLPIDQALRNCGE